MTGTRSTHIELKEDSTIFYITNKECSNGVEIIAARVEDPQKAPLFENTAKIARIYIPDDKFIKLAEALQFEAEKRKKKETKKEGFVLRYNMPEEDEPNKKATPTKTKGTTTRKTTKKGTQKK